MIDFSTAILDLDGKPLSLNAGAVLTLREICTQALLAHHDSDKDLVGSDKVRRFRLAEKIHGADKPIGLPVEAVAEIKALIARQFVPLVVGRAYAILDPASEDA